LISGTETFKWPVLTYANTLKKHTWKFILYIEATRKFAAFLRYVAYLCFLFEMPFIS